MMLYLTRVIALSIAADTQETDQTADDGVAQHPALTPTAKTGKERLGAKWTDEQRVNNCGVPPEKRSSRPRPDSCAGDRDD
ncbi:hypothetical protein AB9K34_24025 [Sedimentitalea sp. XS_ASV28]|uniref:hypothetical protein n=1 Tax=Sedimentitalea sp. XS_ASV28 TaxID=3241296 RepID=UPI0035175E76